MEAENINLNDDSLAESLPDIHEHVDAALVATTALTEKFQTVHDEFVVANPIVEE